MLMADAGGPSSQEIAVCSGQIYWKREGALNSFLTDVYESIPIPIKQKEIGYEHGKSTFQLTRYQNDHKSL